MCLCHQQHRMNLKYDFQHTHQTVSLITQNHYEIFWRHSHSCTHLSDHPPLTNTSQLNHITVHNFLVFTRSEQTENPLQHNFHGLRSLLLTFGVMYCKYNQILFLYARSYIFPSTPTYNQFMKYSWGHIL